MNSVCATEQLSMAGSVDDLSSRNEVELLMLLMRGVPGHTPADSIQHALEADAASVSNADIHQAREIIEIARLLTEKRAARKMHGRNVIDNPKAVRDYLVARLGSARREELGCLFLDASFAVLRYEPTAIGSVSEVTCHPREIARRCIELDAEHVFLVHQHPSANVSISQADKELTLGVKVALYTLGITLHDHYLIAGDQCISIRESVPEVFDTV